MKVLVTGAAGFIGYHLVNRLVKKKNVEVIGLDSINDYYDVNLKFARLEQAGIPREEIKPGYLVQSKKYANYRFIRMDLVEKGNLFTLFKGEKFDRICHLAAQAGVRYSLENPYAYIHSNIIGFLNILEACKREPTGHLVYASSSSVYGLNKKMPLSTRHNVDHPASFYAATKKSCELLSHSYSYIYDIPSSGLRFFSVYGPWGRPDMALFQFVSKILEDEPIDVYNEGKMQRDFTYIDDIVAGTISVLENPPRGDEEWDGMNPDPSSSAAPYKIYNIGNNQPVQLLDFIETIEKALGKKAKMKLLPLQPGDVTATWADVDELREKFAYSPNTPIQEGVRKFVEWYLDYYNISL